MTKDFYGARIEERASLPYAGTSGWSGSDASRERAEERDHSGKTGRIQWRIEQRIPHYGPRGMTIKELRDAFPAEHHGTLSGALTALHKDGRILRLTEKRDKCSVYVAPPFLMDRECVPPKQKKQPMTEEQIASALEYHLRVGCPDRRCSGLTTDRALAEHLAEVVTEAGRE